MTQRLPTPGSDSGDWGEILNNFLAVAHNADGTLNTSAVGIAGAALTNNNLSDLPNSITARTNLGLGSVATLSSSVGGDLNGSLPTPTVAKINGVTLPSTAPAPGNVLTATNSTTTTWSTPAGGVTIDATLADIQPDTITGTAAIGSTGKAADAGHQHALVIHDHGTNSRGGTLPEASVTNLTTDLGNRLQLAGDITGGSASSPQVTGTHLTSSLPISQGGTGSTTQSFVDLTSVQTIAGSKSFSTIITGNISGNAATVTTNANLSGDVTSSGNITTVDKVNGIAVTGTPAIGQALVATSTTTASWTTATGPQGPTGMNWRGAYSNSTTYGVNDAVYNSIDGCSYICILGVTGTIPPNATYWSLLAQSGAQGIPQTLHPATNGDETMSRMTINSNSVVLVSGVLELAYFTANKTETINTLIVGTGSASSGATLAQFGVYSVNSSTGALTLITSTVNNTGLWSVAYQPPVVTAYSNSATLSSSWSKVAGTVYAIGLLFIGGTAPNVTGSLVCGGLGDGGVAPRISGEVTGQSSLPASVAAVNINTVGLVPYIAMTS